MGVFLRDICTEIGIEELCDLPTCISPGLQYNREVKKHRHIPPRRVFGRPFCSCKEKKKTARGRVMMHASNCKIDQGEKYLSGIF